MTDIPRLRKRPLEADAAVSGRAANEIDIVSRATISYSSEDPAHPVEHLLGYCQVNLSRSEKLDAERTITLPLPHSAIRPPLRLERSAALIARRDGVEG
jgi:hypothetical protein